jgi:putative Mg2+ transporter-C (MgtC) family protein
VLQGLITVIGFLGAGCIVKSHTGEHVHGLTTAAGMWLAGAVGMTAALGYYAIGAFVCALAVVVLLLLKAVERALDRRRPKSSETDAETAGDDDR